MDPNTSSRTWLLTLIVALVVALGTGVVASSGEVEGWEEDAFHVINDLPDWLESVMWVFQLAGLLLVPVGVALVAAAMRRWRVVIVLLALVPLKLLVEKAVVKNLVERERPGTTICGFPDDFDTACANFRGDVPLAGLSFVSGHAIIAWAVATILWPVLPNGWRWAPVAVATLNAVARIYLGAHNVLDVVGGAAIGVALGAALVLVTGIAKPPRLADVNRPSGYSPR